MASKIRLAVRVSPEFKARIEQWADTRQTTIQALLEQGAHLVLDAADRSLTPASELETDVVRMALEVLRSREKDYLQIITSLLALREKHLRRPP